MSHSEAANKL